MVFVLFAHGRPTKAPVDVNSGFLITDGKALGRPAGMAFDHHSALLVADDVGNVI